MRNDSIWLYIKKYSRRRHQEYILPFFNPPPFLEKEMIYDSKIHSSEMCSLITFHTFTHILLVRLGFGNKIPGTGRLHNRRLFLTVLEAGNPRSRSSRVSSW